METYSDKVCVLCVPDGDDGVNLFNELLFLIIPKVHVPLGKARLTGAVLNQNETNLHNTEKIGWIIRIGAAPPFLHVQNIEKRATDRIDKYWNFYFSHRTGTDHFASMESSLSSNLEVCFDV